MRLLVLTILACLSVAGYMWWTLRKSWPGPGATSRPPTTMPFRPAPRGKPTAAPSDPEAGTKTRTSAAPTAGRTTQNASKQAAERSQEAVSPESAAEGPPSEGQVRYPREAGGAAGSGAQGSELREVLENDPFNEAALRAALDRAKQNNQWADVAEAARRLVVLSPESDSIRVDRAMALLRLGNFAEAAVSLRELTERQPEDPERWSNLATGLELAGDTAGALDAWGRVLALKPKDAEAHHRRGSLYVHMEAWQSAAADLEVAAAARPEDVELSLELARCYVGMDNWTQADTVLSTAQSAHPRDVRLWNERGELAWREYLRSSTPASLERATEAWRQSLQIAPGQAEVREKLGRAQAARGE